MAQHLQSSLEPLQDNKEEEEEEEEEEEARILKLPFIAFIFYPGKQKRIEDARSKGWS